MTSLSTDWKQQGNILKANPDPVTSSGRGSPGFSKANSFPECSNEQQVLADAILQRSDCLIQAMIPSLLSDLKKQDSYKNVALTDFH